MTSTPANISETAVRAGAAQRWALVALTVLLCGGVLYARVLQMASGGSATERAFVALQSAGAEVQDREIPTAAMTKLEPHPQLGTKGTETLLADALGRQKVVLLNFWATWCPPCIDELASLRQLAVRLQPDGVQVIAVSYDDGWPEQMAALKRHLGSSMPTPILWARDPQGQDGAEQAMMRVRFGTRKLPETYVLVGNRVMARFVGEQDWTDANIERSLRLVAEATR